MEDRHLGSSSIIIRMSAIRKLAAEAADNGLLAPELAAGISRVKSAKTQGIRTGNWLSQKQALALLSAPDISTLRGLRDRAILAVLHRLIQVELPRAVLESLDVLPPPKAAAKDNLRFSYSDTTGLRSLVKGAWRTMDAVFKRSGVKERIPTVFATRLRQSF